MEDRVCYSKIKRYILEGLYSACRAKGYKGNWSQEDILAYLYEDYRYCGESYEGELDRGLGAFDSPVEYLMLEVVFLTLSGSWSSKQSFYYRQQIENILKFHTLDSMLSGVPTEERMEFELDLKGLDL